MDTGEGKLELLRSLEEALATKEEYPNSRGIFTVGEELEIKGSRFRVKEITPFGIKLKILPALAAAKEG